MKLSYVTLAAVCAAMTAIVPTAGHAQGSRAPTLLVVISVDQLRGDYLSRFGHQLTGGLARLSRGGAWFTNAHHDHAITETAPGHATLLAGRFPRSTGIAANRAGVDDVRAPLIGGGIGLGASPHRFTGTTLVDWLAAKDARTRAFSVSSKDRGAILPIGKSRAEVYWYSPNGLFTTSAYYRDTLPSWVTEFNVRRLPHSYAGRVWSLLLPEASYAEPDSVPAEGGVNFLFPHIVPDDTTAATNVLRGTPFIDEITVAFALHGLTSLRLGTGPQTDVLAVSLSGTDYVGHRYGPDSRELHDQILRLDRMLGAFLDSIYQVRDSSRVTVVLTSDHGVGTIPELASASLSPRPTRATLSAFFPALRAGLIAAKVDTNAVDFDVQIVTFDRAAFAAAGADVDSAMKAVANALRAVPGIRRVDRFHALLPDSASDPIARRWAHQFPAAAQIDLVITLTHGSTWRGNIATHGSPYDYDSHVPLIFYGAGVKPGRHEGFVRTVDLAPTLAAIAAVSPAEHLDGVVLKVALP